MQFENQQAVQQILLYLERERAEGTKVRLGTIGLTINGRYIEDEIDEDARAVIKDVALTYVAKRMLNHYLDLLENHDISFPEQDVYTVDGIKALLLAD